MIKWVAVVVPVSILAFILGGILWLAPVGSPVPTSAQLPYFIGLGAFESVSFGLGVAFLLFGYASVKGAVRDQRRLALAVYLSIAWLLLNWWPHDGMHRVIGEHLQGLLYVEYAFHVTLIIAGAILAYVFFKLFANKG